MDSWYREVETASKSSLFGLSIGIDNEYYKDFLKYKPNILLVDVANGYTQNLRKFCSDVNEVIKDISPNTLLMAGNVATLDGVDSLVEVGVKMIRVGIGGGGLCSTRNVTGIGVSQLSAIMECSASGAFIVSDGGIKQSGDVVKALCAGADLAMAGSIFAKTFESPSDGVIFGMASRRLQEEMSMLQIKSVEGFEKAVQKELPLSQLVEEYSWGIKSAGTYLNARNIDEMRKNATFVLSGKGSVKQL